MALPSNPSAWDEIKEKVGNGLDSLKSYFSKDTKGQNLYPNSIDEKLIQVVQSKNWNKSLAYSFFVKDKHTNQPVKSFSEFKLQINPQTITQDEQFAINITPTQDGIISEHNGIVFRDLQIAGTTGVNPNRGSTGAKADGKTLSNPNSRTGYEEFHHLRNYLRAYATYKKDNANRNHILTFLNRKDGEELIIEPVRFSMKRNGQRASLYDYDIQFKVIGNLQFNESPTGEKSFFQSLSETVAEINDTLAAGRAVLLKGADLLRQVEREVNTTIFEPLRQMDLMIKTFGSFDTQLGSIGDGIVARINASLTLNILNEMKDDPSLLIAGVVLPINTQKASAAGGNALLAIRKDAFLKVNMDESRLPAELAKDFAAERNVAMGLPKSYFEDLQETLTRVADNATEFFGLGDPDYNTYADRPQTFIPSPTKQTTNQELEILYAFSQVQQALNLLLAYGNDHFQANLSAKFTEAENDFNQNISVPYPTSVDEVIIAPGQTIEDLAVQHLNDFTRWPEIVELNNLIPPYITDASINKRVKQYGQKILIPSNGTQTNTDVIIVREDKYNNKLSETEKRLGIDIKLSQDFDFILNNNNDFEVITGGSNAGQAIRIKFNLQKGDLKLHPELGIGLPIGEKITSADQIYDEVVNTILQDSRFESIKDFNLLVEGGTIVVKLNLLVVESSTPVPLTLNL